MKNTTFTMLRLSLLVISLSCGYTLLYAGFEGGPYVEGMPLLVEYTISPDIIPYEVGQEVTVNYTITFDVVNCPSEVSKQFLVWEHNYQPNMQRNKAVILRNSATNDIIIDMNNPSYTNTLIYRITERTNSFVDGLTICRLADSTSTKTFNFPFLKSNYDVDLFSSFSIMSSADQKVIRKFRFTPAYSF